MKKFGGIKKSAYLCNAKAETHIEIFAKIAQLVEHDLAKVGVAGSSPVFRSSTLKYFNLQVQFSLLDTTLAKIAQLVEHDLAKVGVAGSSPVFRSILADYFV